MKVYFLLVTALTSFASVASADVKDKQCSCNPLAANYPGVVLIHSSDWGASGLKLFPFGDADPQDAVTKCEELKLKLEELGVCPAQRPMPASDLKHED